MTLGRLDFLYRTGLDQDTLDVWIRAEWLAPSPAEDDPEFTETDLARARLIQELKHDLGVNDEGIGVILNLIDQVHGLRRVMADVIDMAREQLQESKSGGQIDQDHGRE